MLDMMKLLQDPDTIKLMSDLPVTISNIDKGVSEILPNIEHVLNERLTGIEERLDSIAAMLQNSNAANLQNGKTANWETHTLQRCPDCGSDIYANDTACGVCGWIVKRATGE
jgi:uncharacterized Zn ribbon protein